MRRDPIKFMQIYAVTLANKRVSLDVLPRQLTHLRAKRIDSVFELSPHLPVPFSRQIGKGTLHLQGQSEQVSLPKCKDRDQDHCQNCTTENVKIFLPEHRGDQWN